MEPQSEMLFDFEDEVRAALVVTDAPKGFLDHLREQIYFKSSENVRTGKGCVCNRGPAWALVLALILITFMAIGPFRVFAELEQYLSYVTGAGFVNTENAMALQKPVSQTHNGRTVKIEQLVASENETVLVIRLTGYADFLQASHVVGVRLVLPSGDEFAPGDSSFEMAYDGRTYVGAYKFKSLPKGTSRIAVRLYEQKITHPSDIKYYKINLRLYPISDPEVAKLLPGSYTFANNASEKYGITVKVESVSSSAENSGIRVQFIYPLALGYVWYGFPVLQDDRSLHYSPVPIVNLEDQGGGDLPYMSAEDEPIMMSNHWTYAFEDVPLDSHQLKLTFDHLAFYKRVSARFTLEISENPQVGDVYPIHKRLLLGGLSLEVVQARIVQLGSTNEDLIGIVLDIEPTIPNQLRVNEIHLSVNGSSEKEELPAPRWKSYTPGFILQNMHTGDVKIEITGISGYIQGPWEIQWTPELP